MRSTATSNLICDSLVIICDSLVIVSSSPLLRLVLPFKQFTCMCGQVEGSVSGRGDSKFQVHKSPDPCGPVLLEVLDVGEASRVLARLQVYLDEFVFRHNRRRLPMAAFQTLLGLGTGQKPTPYGRIRGANDLCRSCRNGGSSLTRSRNRRNPSA